MIRNIYISIDSLQMSGQCYEYHPEYFLTSLSVFGGTVVYIPKSATDNCTADRSDERRGVYPIQCTRPHIGK